MCVSLFGVHLSFRLGHAGPWGHSLSQRFGNDDWNLPNDPILFPTRTNERHCFFLWRGILSYVSMADHWNDLSTVRIGLPFWTILSHCGTVNEGRSGGGRAVSPTCCGAIL